MTETKSNPVEEQILSTLTKCLLKMSDRLLKTFDPLSKESLALFKQFCSALNTRRQWLKTACQEIKNSVKTIEKVKNLLANKTLQTIGEPSTLEKLMNTPNPNYPLRPEDLQSGLVYKR